MNGQLFFSLAYAFICSDRVSELSQLVEENMSLQFDENDFEKFISLFSSARKELSGCVNINGSGGSRIPKLNISSIASIYVAAITGIKVVKTGSVSRTSLAGSTELFDRLGLLHSNMKNKGLELYNFAYYDFLQISSWKRYREILMLNQSLKDFINNGVFFDYPASTYCMGIAIDHYYDIMQACKSYSPPSKLITFYTNTKYGVVDEIIQGDVYVNGCYRLTLDGEIFLPHHKEEVIEEDIRLIYGRSDNENCIDSVRYTTALLINELCGCSVDEGVSLFNVAYSKGAAGRLVDGLIKYNTQ